MARRKTEPNLDAFHAQLDELKLSFFREHYPDIVQRAAKEQWDHLAVLEQLVDGEASRRSVGPRCARTRPGPCSTSWSTGCTPSCPGSRQDAAGGGHPLCAQAPAAAAAVSGARLPGARQQCRRARNAPHCSGKKKLSVHGIGGRRKGRFYRLYPHRNGQDERPRPPGVAHPVRPSW